jgi:hypothetical protein
MSDEMTFTDVNAFSVRWRWELLSIVGFSAVLWLLVILFFSIN